MHRETTRSLHCLNVYWLVVREKDKWSELSLLFPNNKMQKFRNIKRLFATPRNINRHECHTSMKVGVTKCPVPHHTWRHWSTTMTCGTWFRRHKKEHLRTQIFASVVGQTGLIFFVNCQERKTAFFLLKICRIESILTDMGLICSSWQCCPCLSDRRISFLAK